jgi:hypothetical protein
MWRMSEPRVVPVDRLELAFETYFWSFADERRAHIDAHWEKVHREKPSMWNGQVLMAHRWGVEGRVFRGAHFACDFASFLAWRDWEFPDDTVRNGFAAAAIRGSDGGFLLGVMGDHTANARTIYFPCGMLDINDVKSGVVDLAGSVWREIGEETGLGRGDLTEAPGWQTVFIGPRIAHIKTLHARETAEALRERILAFTARDNEPELSDIVIVRKPSDCSDKVAPFVMAFLNSAWSSAG